MTEARKVIFINHVNDDPDAEQVLRALTDDANGLKEQLKPTHDAYDLASTEISPRAVIGGARSPNDWSTARPRSS